MANLSIPLTFSEDGEYLQLSRMDAAVLLTWVLGGDHDGDISSLLGGAPKATDRQEPARAQADEKPAPTPPPAVLQAPRPLTAPKQAPQSAPVPAQVNPVVAPRPEPELKTPEPERAKAPETKVPSLPKTPPASKPVEEKPVEVSDLPFAVIPSTQEKPRVITPPTPGELLEDEAYWEYGDAPVPSNYPKL